MRGVNHGHVWFPERMDESLDAIAATGANCVRLVLSCGGQWRRVPGQELAGLLDACRRRGLVAIPEVHDCTGWGEKSDARPLSEAVDYWLASDIREAMVEMQRVFEAWVREYPEQWMWSNRRWS